MGPVYLKVRAQEVLPAKSLLVGTGQVSLLAANAIGRIEARRSGRIVGNPQVILAPLGGAHLDV
jgi:hypothetical protein